MVISLPRSFPALGSKAYALSGRMLGFSMSVAAGTTGFAVLDMPFRSVLRDRAGRYGGPARAAEAEVRDLLSHVIRQRFGRADLLQAGVEVVLRRQGLCALG